MLNVLNSAALAEQNSFSNSNSQQANTACDGDVIYINTGNPPPNYSDVVTKMPVSKNTATSSTP